MNLSKIRSIFVFSLLALAFLFLPSSSVFAAAGQIQVTISGEDRNPVVNATVEVSCNGTTYATLGTTSVTGTVIGDPTIGTTCANGSGLLFRVSSSTFPTQLYPIIGTTLLPFYSSVDYENASTSISGSSNVFKFGLDTTSTYAMSVWNASGDASVLPFPTGVPDLTFTSSTLAFNWGNNTSPYPGINAQDWFVEATKTVTFGAGWYEFEIASDDGSIVTLDGVTVINAYFLQPVPSRPYIKRLYVTGGSHTVNIKYYEHTGYTGLYFRFYPIDTPSAPFLEIGSSISSPANNRIAHSIGVHTDTAGTLSLSGGCTTTAPVSIGVGTSTISLETLPDGTYSSCQATITDPDTGYTDSADIPSFTIAPPVPIHISTCEQFQAIDTTSTLYAEDFTLDNDIDCTGVTTHPLSWSHPFIGIFDGGGHSISNFTLDDGGFYDGLFEELDGAIIKNLTLASGSVTGSFYVGALAGQATNVTLENVTSYLDVTAFPGSPGIGVGGLFGSLTIYGGSTTTWSNVNVTSTVSGRGSEGGVVGQLTVTGSSLLTLDNIHTIVTVRGRSGVSMNTAGGLIGSLTLSSSSTLALTNSSASTSISLVTGSIGGGVIGQATITSDGGATTLTIDNTSTTGSVTGRSNLGGLIGYLYSTEYGYPLTVNITRSTASVDVTGNSGTDVGGFIGKLLHGSTGAVSSRIMFDSNLSTGDVSGSINVGGFIGGTDTSGAGISLAHTGATGGLTIYNSAATGNVTGNSSGGSNPGAGGFIGFLSCQSNNPTQFAACSLRQNYATGNVQGYQYVGGFIGQSTGDVNIEDSYSTGNITAAQNAGGFIGDMNSSHSFSNVSRVYASSTVTTSGGSPGSIGGLFGSLTSSNSNTNLSHAFAVVNLQDPSGVASSLGWLVGNLTSVIPSSLFYTPVSATTANCIGSSASASFCSDQGDSTTFYRASSNPLAQWDFARIWSAHTETYPTLQQSTVAVTLDTPRISDINVTTLLSGVAITWNTDRIASSKVAYSRDTSYENSTVVTDVAPRVQGHSVAVGGLTNCVTYHFVVVSVDISGIVSTSTDQTFTNSCPNSGGGANNFGSGGSSFGYMPKNVNVDPSYQTNTTSSPTIQATIPTTNTTPLPSINPPPAAQATSTTTCPSYTFTTDLKTGADSIAVTQLQVFLNAHGARVAKTGWGSPGKEATTFGKATKAALITFQKANGLPANGIFSGATRALIQSLIPRSTCTNRLTFTRELKSGMRGTDVRALQRFLNTNNFLLGPTAAESRDYETGFFGPATKKTLQLFQKANRLPPTGQVDPSTAALIGRK